MPDARVEILGDGPGAMTLAPEQTYHRGTINSIWFLPMEGATAGYMEWSPDPAFAGVTYNSGWFALPRSNQTARNLTEGQTYYYRLKARNEALVESPWSVVLSSTPDASAPESEVLALATATRGPTFTIRSTSTDTISGVKEVWLYYRHEGMVDFALWPQPFAGDTLTFDASAAASDGLYEFYSIAEEAVGNKEQTPASPDGVTSVIRSTPARRWILYR